MQRSAQLPHRKRSVTSASLFKCSIFVFVFRLPSLAFSPSAAAYDAHTAPSPPLPRSPCSCSSSHAPHRPSPTPPAQALTSKDGESSGVSRTEQAKQLLKQYGSAYLITSISFAVVSFAACYAAVSAGVDVAALLAKVGLQVNATNEKVGTFAIAYAAHKALSPVRFPPTVALTPVVAKWLGKKGE